MPLQQTAYTNASILTPRGVIKGSILVDGTRIHAVRHDDAGHQGTDRADTARTREVDLGGRFVLPGFVDAHTHLLMLGQSLQKVQLRGASSLAEIQEAVKDARRRNPGAPRILGGGWLYSALDGTAPDRAMLDAAVEDVPVYLDANDLHSVWVNSAALAELGITADTEDPHGGSITRDPETGEATGMLLETAAQQIVWPALARQATDTDRDSWLESAISHYLASGVTSVVDMAVEDNDLQAFLRAEIRHGGELPLRIKGHWFVHRRPTVEENLQQVHRAVELAAQVDSPTLKMAGIKLVLDGVIDSCTAAMKEPYFDGTNGDPIWDREALIPVVAAADAAGLQIAIHAIGDEASDIALDALEAAYAINGPRDRRHRIEHLETVTPENVVRLARLGVVASMQPVHADPAIQHNWQAMLGDDRTDRAYPWVEFIAAGATLALSTDAPTAPHEPLPNMYVAATRKSALDQSLPANLPRYALDLESALHHATRDAAYSCRAERQEGSIEPGFLADFAVLEADPLSEDPIGLLSNQTCLVVVNGVHRYETPSGLLSRREEAHQERIRTPSECSPS
ncbi:amidohydrolase [Arthrobacter burdickii]|uniref:Amidohydrolase n=1 Tax=Arthrobacter burdickii TaxID=3035920 RepID=A0ABT8K3G4_9MICC|nr:amidohydrolase [Arthrobacter burdickii]MDN4611533.1 amidohydrolase [Arthrobacter burdickii]